MSVSGGLGEVNAKDRWRLFSTLGLMVLFSLACRADAATQDVADLVLLDAKVYTEDSARSIAQSFAVKDKRIAFVGKSSGAKRLIGPHTMVVHGRRRLVLPGLVDSHIHPTLMIDFPTCNLHGRVMPLAEITRTLQACLARARPKPDEWIYVTLWEYGAGNDPDPTYKNLRATLDAAAPRNPVFMIGTDGHHAAYNSGAGTAPRALKNLSSGARSRLALSAPSQRRLIAEFGYTIPMR